VTARQEPFARQEGARRAGAPAVDLVERAVAAGIITDEQASAMRSLPPVADPTPARQVPAYAEVFGYLGAVLVIVGAVALVAQFWSDLGTVPRLAVLGGAAAALWGAGALVDEGADPALWRLRGVLWLLSSGAFAAFVAILGADGFGWEGEAVAVTTGGLVALASASLWQLRDRPGQHLSCLVGAAVAIGATGGWADGAGAVGVGLWALGALWVGLGLREVLPPSFVALVLGAGLALLGSGVTGGSWADVGPLFGLVTAGGLLALGTFRNRFLLTGAGVLGLLFYVPSVATQFFADSFGVPVVLLASGMALLAGALVILRRGPLAGGPRTDTT
jgi:hypothetical protein